MKNPLRQKCIRLLISRCNRCGYQDHPEILKLLTPTMLTRKGKGQVAYWSEVLHEIKRRIKENEGIDEFELVCPNCFEIERLQKREQPKVEPKKKKVIWVWETDLDPMYSISWCDECHSKGEFVYYWVPTHRTLTKYGSYIVCHNPSTLGLKEEDLQNCKTPKRFEVYENATKN